MKNIHPSMSKVEEKKKESKEEEEEDGFFLTEKDLKDRNIDTDAKVSSFIALVEVGNVAKEKEKEREEKQKEHATLKDGKRDKLLREKAFKKPADYFDSKKKEKFNGEKLLSPAIKSYGKRYGEEGLNQNFKAYKHTSDPVHDVFTNRKRRFASMKLLSSSTEKVNDEGLKQDTYMRTDNIFKRSHDQVKSNKRFKEHMPNCNMSSLAYLPQEVKERIASMNGKDVELVLEKQLYPTDMKDGNGRLSMPLGQVTAKNFLKDEEKNALRDGNCLKVKILEPSLEMISDMNFKQWNMSKESGNVSSSYVFTTHWNSLRKRNGLNLLDTIQLWCFRVEEDLYFAFVKVRKGKEQSNKPF